MILTSDLVLLNDPDLGRCWFCQMVVWAADMVSIPLEVKEHYVEACPGCAKQEATQ